MSSSAHSNISQDNTKIFKIKWQEIQQLLIQLEEVVKLCQAEHVVQKARRKAEKKAWEEAER